MNIPQLWDLGGNYERSVQSLRHHVDKVHAIATLTSTSKLPPPPPHLRILTVPFITVATHHHRHATTWLPRDYHHHRHV